MNAAIAQWDPDDPVFWAGEGRSIARPNPAFSTFHTRPLFQTGLPHPQPAFARA
jgi:hypothetical protein